MKNVQKSNKINEMLEIERVEKVGGIKQKMDVDMNHFKIRFSWHLLRPVIVVTGEKGFDKDVRCTAKQ